MTQKTIGIINVVILVLLLALGVAIWFTASTVLSIVFGVLLLIGALNITGVTASLFGKE